MAAIACLSPPNVYVCVISLLYARDLEPNQVWIKALNKYFLNEWMSFLWNILFSTTYSLNPLMKAMHPSCLFYLSSSCPHHYKPMDSCYMMDMHVLSYIRTVSHVVPLVYAPLYFLLLPVPRSLNLPSS